MQSINVQAFADIEEEFHRRVSSMVWCSAATVDTKDRPRSRVLHPVWEDHIGWIFTYRKSPKSKHLAHQPYMSLAYVADPLKPVYVDCTVNWVDNMDERKRVWQIFKTTPDPYGYDPGPIFGDVNDLSVGLLKLVPWRIEVYTIGVETYIWRPSS